MPHALSTGEVGDLIYGYVATARGIAEAGMDGVEVHASHGYLLNRFLSPYYNRRDDEYRDGTLLLRRILEQVRETAGAGRLLGVRLQVDEGVPGGLDPAAASGIAVAIAPLIDYLSLSIGNHDGLRLGRPAIAYTSPWLVGSAPAASGARLIRSALADAGLAVPVVVTGRITTADVARRLLTDGTADLVGLARALIADPDFAAKAVAGKDDQIVQCIGCNECIRTPFSCTVNPHSGREGQLSGAQVGSGQVGSAAAAAVGRTRRIVVVGAGPAGVQVAAGTAERGHSVVLLDAAPSAGGVLRDLVRTPLLAGWRPLLSQLERCVLDSKVDYRPDTVATEDVIAELGPEVVVWAVGSTPAPADFPADAPLLTTRDLLAGARPDRGVRVVVVGGMEPGLEPFLAADVLTGEGWPVVLLSQRRDPGSDLDPRTLNALLSRLLHRRVDLRPMIRVVGWTGGRMRTEHVYGGPPADVEAAAVVLAHGQVASQPLPGAACAYAVGDALAPRRLTHAMLEGARFGAALLTSGSAGYTRVDSSVSGANKSSGRQSLRARPWSWE
jgi:2,4-dienoyl-CoA reductase (NADPH2)